ncbi:MAG: hypothetical protein KJ648_07195 [Candidatus Omnitrophica bacterium]|nr:hypothetical protein [Candidatus Omnitrophota bacterium]
MFAIDWDEAHRTRSQTLLGYTTADDYHALFNQVGDFTLQVQRARQVLEVGPGLGSFLASLQPEQRLALEISEVNKAKLRASRICLMGDFPVPEYADVAVCLSVLQHCDESQARVIFTKVAGALMRSVGWGPFYANAVEELEGLKLAPSEISRGWSLLELRRLAAWSRLELAEHKTLPVPNQPLLHHLMRFEVIR